MGKLVFRLFVSIAIFLTTALSLRAQERESIIKAGFVEKFTHFVQWPGSESEIKVRTFVIGFAGDNSIREPLYDILHKSKFNNGNFSFVIISELEQIDNCNLLIIAASKSKELPSILTRTRGKPILTVSDAEGFAEKGVIINMFQDGNYIRYKINQLSMKESGLQINSMLLNYAIII